MSLSTDGPERRWLMKWPSTGLSKDVSILPRANGPHNNDAIGYLGETQLDRTWEMLAIRRYISGGQSTKLVAKKFSGGWCRQCFFDNYSDRRW